MGLDWGTVPEWVAGIGTTGTLLTGMVILGRERSKIATEEADNLRATLDVEGDDYARPSDLTMTICNFGHTTFWDVRIFRCADVVPAGQSEGEWRWYVAELDFVDAQTTYKWVVEEGVTLGTGRAPHPRSFESFVHRGVSYARYRRRALQPVTHSRHERHLGKQVKEFEQRDDVVVLEYRGAKVSRRW